MPQNTIVITTGMTGGHFFPALSFAEAFHLREPETDIIFLISRENPPFDLAPYRGSFRFHCIPIRTPPTTGFAWRRFSFLVHYLASIVRTFFFMSRVRPKTLVSFGSYSSFPAVLAAWLWGVPVIVHEQNLVAGKANRLAAHFACTVATAFPQTVGGLPEDRMRRVGFPLRRALRLAADRQTVKAKSAGDKFTVLVLGGSQGAQVINDAFCGALSQLSAQEKKGIAVIHIAGMAQQSQVETRYAALGIDARVYAFFEQMELLYPEADVVIARAGAGTIFELAAFGIPAVLVPYPYAYAHQMKNAEWVRAKGAAILLAQLELTPERLCETIRTLRRDVPARRDMSNAARQLDVSDADQQLARIVQGCGK